VPCEQRHVWVVRSGPDACPMPIKSKEAARVYRKAGWQVTKLPLAALSEDEMRCLGVQALRLSRRVS
jgi:hypothetical protein